MAKLSTANMNEIERASVAISEAQSILVCAGEHSREDDLERFRQHLQKKLARVSRKRYIPSSSRRLLPTYESSKFRRETVSPSGDHFSTFNNYWDASPKHRPSGSGQFSDCF